MAEYIVQDTTLTAIADAVRAKKGTTEPIALTDFATEIESIQSGGGSDNNKLSSALRAAGYEYELTAEELSGIGAIEDYRFANNFGLKKISIPEGVTYIGEYAFHNCVNLEEVYIPSTVIKISTHAFYGCKSLRVVNFAQDGVLRDIGDYCFSGTHILELVVPNSVETIGEYVFADCSLLHSVKIGAGVRDIGRYSFYNCRSLKYFEIDTAAKLKKIPNNLLSNCNELEEAIFPATIEDIEVQAFSNCKKLKAISDFPLVKTIGTQAFGHCYNLNSDLFEHNDCLQKISDGAFGNCYSLVKITLPRSLKEIHTVSYKSWENAFNECCNLVEVYNKSTLQLNIGATDNGYVAYYAKNIYTPTQGASKLSTDENGYVLYSDDDDTLLVDYVGKTTDFIIPNGVTRVQPNAFRNRDILMDSLTIPDSVKTIGEYAFYEHGEIKRVVIGRGVTEIGDNAFYLRNNFSMVYNYSQLWLVQGSTDNGYIGVYAEEIINVNDTPLEIDANGFVTYRLNNDLVLADYVGQEEKVCIPSGISILGRAAFYKNTKIKTVTIPETVTKVDEVCFANCSYLRSVSFSGENNIETFGVRSFAWCWNLSTPPIGEKTTTLDTNAFYLSGIVSVTIPSSVTNIGSNNAFNGCYKLVEVYNKSTLQLNIGATDNGYVAYYAKNIYTPTQGASKLSTDENGYVLYSDDNDTLLVDYVGEEQILTLPEGITTIHDCAFRYKKGISDVFVGENVRQINKYAFDYSTIRKIHFAEQSVLDTIGDYAFEYSQLEEISIPNSVKTIKRGCFFGCNNLEKLYIPSDSSLETIEDDAISVLPNTLKINLPQSVKTIGNSALGADNLIVSMYDSVVEIGKYSYPWCINWIGSFSKMSSFSNLEPTVIFVDSKPIVNMILDENTTSIYAPEEQNYEIISVDASKAINVTGVQSFSGSRNMISFEFNSSAPLTKIKSRTFANCNKLMFVANIPESVTEIEYSAFNSCNNLLSINIPPLTTEIGDNAFSECESLRDVTFGENSQLTIIGSSCFSNCKNLDNIIIPKNVATIEPYTFSDCESLSNLTFEPNSTLLEIRDNAFGGCNISYVEIPESVTTIGYRAIDSWRNENGLTIVMKSQTPPSCDWDPFGNINHVNKIIVPHGSADAYKTATNLSQYADKIVEATE